MRPSTAIRIDELTGRNAASALTHPARSVRLLTGGEPKEEMETMPRKPKSVIPPALDQKPPPPTKRKYTKRAKASAADGPRFGVFEDGTIELALPGCSGTIGAEDARALVGFLRRIGVDA